MELKDRKILVTGGAGFIGSHLIDRLVLMGNRVVVAEIRAFMAERGGNVLEYKLNREGDQVRYDFSIRHVSDLDFEDLTGLLMERFGSRGLTRVQWS